MVPQRRTPTETPASVATSESIRFFVFSQASIEQATLLVEPMTEAERLDREFTNFHLIATKPCECIETFGEKMFNAKLAEDVARLSEDFQYLLEHHRFLPEFT
jgi:hypothetical protein